MASKTKKGQMKIDHFFKKVTKEESNNLVSENDMNAEKHLSDVDVIFVQEVTKKGAKRKADQVSLSTSMVKKVPNLKAAKSPRVKKETNDRILPVEGFLKLRKSEISSPVSSNDQSFTKLNPFKNKNEKIANEKNTYAVIEEDAIIISSSENDAELSPEICNKDASPKEFFQNSNDQQNQIDTKMNNLVSCNDQSLTKLKHFENKNERNPFAVIEEDAKSSIENNEGSPKLCGGDSSSKDFIRLSNDQQNQVATKIKNLVSCSDQSLTKLKPFKNKNDKITNERNPFAVIEEDAIVSSKDKNARFSPELCDEDSFSKDFMQESNYQQYQTDSKIKQINLSTSVINKEDAIRNRDEKEQNQIDQPKTKLLFDGKTFHNFFVSAIEKEKNGELMLKLEQKDEKINCVLRGMWTTTLLKIGDSVNIKSNKFDGTTVFIDNIEGMVVVNPDRLVSSTSISSSVFCMRKTWINEKFASYSSGNKFMLIGCIVHDLFQSACLQKLKSREELLEMINSLINSAYVMDGCYANNLSSEKLMEDLQLYIPSIITWLEKYVHKGPSPISNDNNQQMKVSNILDIEDNYWCTNLGLKGKVDMSVEVEIHEKNKLVKRNIPLELKTGQPSFSFEHQGQVSLYTMMMDSSQHYPCDTGLLLYLKENPNMKQVQVKHSDRTALIQLRNEFVNYSDDFKIGPPTINNERLCSNCDCLLPCSLMLKSFNELALEDSEIMSTTLVPKATSHLSEDHTAFFKKWISMTHMEILTKENVRNPLQNSFWRHKSIELEAKGTAFSNMIFSKNIDLLYTFKRNDPQANIGKHNINIRKGDRVALSEDKCHTLNPRISFAIGFVNKIDSECVEITLEKMLHESFKNIPIRIDLLPIDKSLSQYFANILSLMVNDARALKLRNFIIDGLKPEFKPTITKKIIPLCQPIVKSLNRSQQKAVLKSITAKDYVLICGTPGAGKTTTIVSIIRVLVALGKNVLITSYTHSALDNILMKLKNFDVNFIRIGIRSRIHTEIRKYSLESQMKNIKSVEETKEFYSNIPVVASTCLSLSHPIFEKRTFDYCIMDEASQVNLLASLGPLFVSKKFILVGDPKQLPPVVKSKEAQKMGFDQSLFTLLSSGETVNLTIQYRMNEEIMKIASKLFYDNLLECGSKKVSSATLTQKTDVTFKKSWIAEVLNSNISKAVIFVDTDCVPALEQKDESGLVFNRVEAELVTMLVQHLITNFDLKSNEIGVITPYVKQVEVIRDVCKSIDVEINTVDQYQGRDKDVIIISTVVSCKGKTVKNLLKDKRRLNVAITRAKKKLLIIGSRETLSLYEPFKDLFSILNEHQIFKLPVAANL